MLIEFLSALPLVAGGASAAGVIGLAVLDARADAASAARAEGLREDVEVLPWPEDTRAVEGAPTEAPLPPPRVPAESGDEFVRIA